MATLSSFPSKIKSESIKFSSPNSNYTHNSPSKDAKISSIVMEGSSWPVDTVKDQTRVFRS